MAKTNELQSCPNCQAVWGFDEIQFQTCDACGYPNNDDSEDSELDDFDYENDDEDFPTGSLDY